MKAVISNLEESRFNSAERALNYAFGMEAKRLKPGLSVEQIIKGTNPSDLSMDERIADGIMIKNTALSRLGVKGEAVILAEFTVPIDASLSARKQYNISKLRGFIYQAKPNIINNIYFVEDVVREWTGERPDHSLSWWAKHTNTPNSTLFRWAKSKSEEDKSIYQYLGLWRETAMAIVRVTLAEKGLIP